MFAKKKKKSLTTYNLYTFSFMWVRETLGQVPYVLEFADWKLEYVLFTHLRGLVSDT